MAVKNFWLELSAAKVDREKGVIHDVAVITHGPAKGHGMNVDDVTLSQVHGAMQGRNLKTKLNHGRDVRSVIGTMKNPKNVSGKVTADLHLFKSCPAREYVFELAEEAPDSVGMSIEFEGKDERKPDGSISARCEKLNAVALVDRPAANEGGMFCEVTSADAASVDSPENTNIQTENIAMTEQEQKDFKSAQDSIKALEAKNAELVATLSKVPTAEALAALAASEVTKAFAAVAAAPAPVVPAAPAAPVTPPAKKFSDLVEEQKLAGKSKADAIKFCVATFPKEFREYQEQTLGFTSRNKANIKL
jgi:hypothetical protein